MAIFAFFWKFSSFTASGRSFQYFIKMFETLGIIKRNLNIFKI